MHLSDVLIDTEAVSPCNSVAETQNKPQLEPSSANNLPESPVLGELDGAQLIEPDEVKEPPEADAIAESANAERQSPWHDAQAHSEPEPLTGDDFLEIQPANESESTVEDTPPEVGDEEKPLLPVNDKQAKPSKPVSDAKIAANRRNS